MGKDRVMVYWKYLKLNRNQDEHMIILSSKGNQSLLDKYLSTDEMANNVVGRIFLCAYWVKPVYGADKNIVGSILDTCSAEMWVVLCHSGFRVLLHQKMP